MMDRSFAARSHGRVLMAVIALVICGKAQGPQVPTGEQGVALAGKQLVRATILGTEDKHLRIMLPNQQERVVTLTPEILKRLQLAPGSTYEMLATQKPTPAGIAAALRVEDRLGVYAVAETIRDNVYLLQPEDRQGFQVQQLPAQERTFVYETSCKIVYNVPTVFTIGDSRILLHAQEMRAVHVGKGSYNLTLESSQFVVFKNCPVTPEGPRSQVDYTLVRTR